VVQIIKVTDDEPDWINDIGRIFRIGYYRRIDGLDCVWLVNEEGEYTESVDQQMIRTHFTVLELSRETDLFGAERRIIGPRTESLER
jgi:hypothetical protein